LQGPTCARLDWDSNHKELCVSRRGLTADDIVCRRFAYHHQSALTFTALYRMGAASFPPPGPELYDVFRRVADTKCVIFSVHDTRGLLSNWRDLRIFRVSVLPIEALDLLRQGATQGVRALMAARGPTSFCFGIAAADAGGKYLNLNTICHSLDFGSDSGLLTARFISTVFTTFDVDQAVADWLKTCVSRYGAGQA
jgi:hypothetical protein